MTTSRVLRAVGLFLFLQGVLLGLASGRARTVDEHSLHFMAESWAAQGSFAVPQLVTLGSFYGKTSIRNEPYAPYSPGQPMVSALYLQALGPTFRAAAAKPSGEPMLLANQAATSLLSTTLTAAMGAVFLLAAQAMGVPLNLALLSSLLLVVSTPFLPYSKYGFSEPFLGLLGAVVAGGLVQWDKGDSRGLWCAGLGAGLAVAVKFAVGGLLFGAVGLALLSRAEGRNWRALVRFSLIPVAVITFHLAWNWLRFGDMWDMGYPAVAEAGRRLNDFDTPLLIGLYGLLLTPGKGLLFFAPGLFLSLLGLRAAHRASPSAVVAGVVFFLASLFLYARYSAWEGGYCVGPRYLLPSLPLLWLGLPFLLKAGSAKKRVALFLCLAGVVAQVPAVATSFTEDQIMGGRYYDATYHFRLDFTPAGHWALTSKYLPGLFTGEAWDHPLGLGLDFWFVFLVRAGFDRSLILSWFVTAFACAATGWWLLRRDANRGV